MLVLHPRSPTPGLHSLNRGLAGQAETFPCLPGSEPRTNGGTEASSLPCLYTHAHATADRETDDSRTCVDLTIVRLSQT